MKKLLLAIIVSFISITAFAQFNLYHPFPDSNAYWGEESAFYPGTGTTFNVNDYGYEMLGDTVINSYTYSKVYKVGGSGISGVITPYRMFSYAIRSDSMKHVFMCCQTYIKPDTLLYDFNMKKGDTIKGALVSNSSNGVFYVDSIDSINFNSNYRKRFWVFTDKISKHQEADQIIEGIGSTQGLIDPLTDGFEGGTQVLCFHQNGYVLFSHTSYYTNNSCVVYGPSGVSSISSVPASFDIYPNPASSSITILFQLQQNKNGVLNLYSTMGQLVKSQNISTDIKSITEDISTLANGVYYYTLSVDGVLQATNKPTIIK